MKFDVFLLLRKHGTFSAILFLQLCHSDCSCDISFAVVTLHLQFCHLFVLFLREICSCANEIAVVLMA
jgi:hypothetical protein